MNRSQQSTRGPVSRALWRFALSSATVFGLAICLTACSGGGMATPQQTLQTLRSSAASGDGATFYNAVESETQAYLKDRLRVWKARLARGDNDPEFLAQLPMNPERIRKDSLEDLAIHWFTIQNPLTRNADWFEGAAVASEGQSPSDREASLILRGRDGTERTMWFIRENDRWALDYLRTEWLH